MRVRHLSTALAVASMTALPALASGPKGPATHGNPHVATTSSRSAKPVNAGPKTNPHKPATSTSATHGKPAKAKTATTTTSTGTTTAGNTGTTATPMNPIAQKISGKPNLSTKVQGMLPNGMTLDQASLGFKNQGQFMAALHVSQNLGIPFADLKTAMTGINPTLPPGSTAQPTSTMSLGRAIQKLRPSADSTKAANTAERQATTDLNATTTATPTKKAGK